MSDASRTPEESPSRLAELFNESAHQGEYMDDCECYRYAAIKLNEERDAALERERGLREALLYWLPDETWMEERFPRGDSVAKKHWEMFYKHSALAAKGEK